MFFRHQLAVGFRLGKILDMRLMLPEGLFFIPVLQGITENGLCLFTDKQETKRRILHLPDNAIDRVNQITKASFIGND